MGLVYEQDFSLEAAIDPAMLCDGISTVAEFMVEVLHSRLLFSPAMVCDGVSAVAEFMVKVLHSRLIFSPAIARLLACNQHTCDQ
jgi:hypothetical protein